MDRNLLRELLRDSDRECAETLRLPLPLLLPIPLLWILPVLELPTMVVAGERAGLVLVAP